MLGLIFFCLLIFLSHRTMSCLRKAAMSFELCKLEPSSVFWYIKSVRKEEKKEGHAEALRYEESDYDLPLELVFPANNSKSLA